MSFWGEGRLGLTCCQVVRVSSLVGARASMSASSSSKVLAINCCCGMLQWSSMERISGKGELAKAYFLMARITSRNLILVTSV